MSVFGEFALTLVIALLGATTAFVISHLRKTTGADSSAPIFTLPRRTADWIFVGMACAYVLIFGALSILRHESFHSGGFDLGIFDQIIWNSLHGRLFQVSILVKVSLSLGDHFSPLGMKGSKKLSDFFIDRKIDRPLREEKPLLLCGAKIVWIIGHEIADSVKISARTKTALKLEVTQHREF